MVTWWLEGEDPDRCARRCLSSSGRHNSISVPAPPSRSCSPRHHCDSSSSNKLSLSPVSPNYAVTAPALSPGLFLPPNTSSISSTSVGAARSPNYCLGISPSFSFKSASPYISSFHKLSYLGNQLSPSYSNSDLPSSSGSISHLPLTFTKSSSPTFSKSGSPSIPPNSVPLMPLRLHNSIPLQESNHIFMGSRDHKAPSFIIQPAPEEEHPDASKVAAESHEDVIFTAQALN